MLPTIPNEILFLITDNLDQVLDRLHLSCSCRRFYEVLYPELYTTVDVCCGFAASCLALTLSRRPACAQAVRHVPQHVENKFCRHKRGRGRGLQYSPEEVLEPLLERVACRRGNALEWVYHLSFPDRVEAWIALLVLLVPNLEKLEMGLGGQSTFVLSALADAIPREPCDAGIITLPFSALTSLHLDCYKYGDVYEYQVLPFFHLPALRKFSAHGLENNSTSPRNGNEEGSGFSPVTHLELTAYRANHAFRGLIDACKGLESFIYSPSTVYLSDVYSAPLQDPLYAHRQTLKEVRLRYSRGLRRCNRLEEQRAANQNHKRLVRELVGFPALEKVGLEVNNLLYRSGDDDTMMIMDLCAVLPKGLRMLCLEDFCKCTVPRLRRGLEGLVEHAGTKEGFPALEMVVLRGFKDQITADEMETAFQGRGIKLEYLDWGRARGPFSWSDFCS